MTTLNFSRLKSVCSQDLNSHTCEFTIALDNGSNECYLSIIFFFLWNGSCQIDKLAF